MVVDALYGAIVEQELDRGLAPDPGDAGYVVGRVALEGLDVRDRFRAESAVAFFDGGLIVERPVAHGVAEKHPDPGGYQLESIGVTGEDYGLDLLLASLATERPEKVVGLVSGLLEYGHPKGAHEVLDMVELRPEFRGRGRAMGLVLGESLVPECGGRNIEGYGYMGGLPVAQRLQEYVHVAEDGANILAGGAQAEGLAYGVPGAVDESVAVYEDEARITFQHGEGVGSIHK